MIYLIEFVLFAGLVALIAYLLPGIKLKSFGTAIVVALVFSLLNFGVHLLFSWLGVPLNWPTLGLITFVLNGFLLWLTARIVDGFEVNDLLTIAIAAILLTFGRLVIDRMI